MEVQGPLSRTEKTEKLVDIMQRKSQSYVELASQGMLNLKPKDVRSR